jgi:hypothetical protein
MSFYRVIDEIRSKLYSLGYEDYEVEDACEEAAESLASDIADFVASALESAERMGLEEGMKDFVSELTAIQAGESFVIVTKSGRTDYSTPERKMRDALLKNGKTAKDGSRYARIPVGNNKSIPTSSFDVDKNRQAHLEKVKDDILADIRMGGLGRDVGKAARDYANSFADARKQARQPRNPGDRSGNVRTVSSKQDANSQWVVPAKHLDATTILNKVNNELHDSIEAAMRDLYNEYIG